MQKINLVTAPTNVLSMKIFLVTEAVHMMCSGNQTFISK